MYKTTMLLFITVFFCSAAHLKAQTNGFASTIANKTWVVSKYYISFYNQDKKELFNNFTFKFLAADTRSFLAIDNSESIADTCKGYWNEDDSKVTLSLTLEPDDKANYKVALLLNKAEMQETGISPTKLSFRIPDVMGYVVVEFTEK